MTIVAIHQPNYLPWLGFFKKIKDSDIFVFLDDVQYSKNGWHNRNKIRVREGSMWLTVPTKLKFGMKLNEVKIDNSLKWIEKHKKTIEINYSKAAFFYLYWKELEDIYDTKFDLLIDLNIKIINFILKNLHINTKIIFSSELKISSSSSDRILDICKKLNCDTYLSGIFGTEYLNIKDFEKNNIIVNFQNFQHPVYKQVYEPFLPNMASIDLLFNEGNGAEQFFK